jgi:hypothetical protein
MRSNAVAGLHGSEIRQRKRVRNQRRDGRALSDGTGIEAGSPLFFCCTVKTVARLIFLQHIQNTFVRHYVSWPGGETTDQNAHFEKDREKQTTINGAEAGVEGRRMGAAADGGGSDGVLAGAARGFCVG